MSEHGKAGRERLNAIAMAHPDLEHARKVAEERILGAIHRYRSRAILAAAARGDTSTQPLRKQLHPVADAEHRHAQLEDFPPEPRRALVVDAVRPAGQYDPPERFVRPAGNRRRVVQNFAVYAGLAHAPADQLVVLAAEIQDHDLL